MPKTLHDLAAKARSNNRSFLVSVGQLFGWVVLLLTVCPKLPPDTQQNPSESVCKLVFALVVWFVYVIYPYFTVRRFSLEIFVISIQIACVVLVARFFWLGCEGGAITILGGLYIGDAKIWFRAFCMCMLFFAACGLTGNIRGVMKNIG